MNIPYGTINDDDRPKPHNPMRYHKIKSLHDVDEKIGLGLSKLLHRYQDFYGNHGLPMSITMMNEAKNMKGGNVPFNFNKTTEGKVRKMLMKHYQMNKHIDDLSGDGLKDMIVGGVKDTKEAVDNVITKMKDHYSRNKSVYKKGGLALATGIALGIAGARASTPTIRDDIGSDWLEIAREDALETEDPFDPNTGGTPLGSGVLQELSEDYVAREEDGGVSALIEREADLSRERDQAGTFADGQPLPQTEIEEDADVDGGIALLPTNPLSIGNAIRDMVGYLPSPRDLVPFNLGYTDPSIGRVPVKSYVMGESETQGKRFYEVEHDGNVAPLPNVDMDTDVMLRARSILMPDLARAFNANASDRVEGITQPIPEVNVDDEGVTGAMVSPENVRLLINEVPTAQDLTEARELRRARFGEVSAVVDEPNPAISGYLVGQREEVERDEFINAVLDPVEPVAQVGQYAPTELHTQAGVVDIEEVPLSVGSRRAGRQTEDVRGLESTSRAVGYEVENSLPQGTYGTIGYESGADLRPRQVDRHLREFDTITDDVILRIGNEADRNAEEIRRNLIEGEMTARFYNAREDLDRFETFRQMRANVGDMVGVDEMRVFSQAQREQLDLYEAEEDREGILSGTLRDDGSVNLSIVKEVAPKQVQDIANFMNDITRSSDVLNTRTRISAHNIHEQGKPRTHKGYTARMARVSSLLPTDDPNLFAYQNPRTRQVPIGQVPKGAIRATTSTGTELRRRDLGFEASSGVARVPTFPQSLERQATQASRFFKTKHGRKGSKGAGGGAK